ncbi:MAG TPA: MarR family transcriptional regulator [Actinomycetes bacterium]|jgi:DNA-binding MarR family transcriptional regulator|nr:MarR family transcriptional regulator [Actinomycetes bacterium]
MTTLRSESGPRELSAGMLAVIGPLRRALRRLLPQDLPITPLPTAQAELLRVVRHRPGIGVGEAAQAIGVAANTVSTLVNQLVAAGLLERGQDPDDRRSARLALTEPARRQAALWLDQREQILADALAEVSAEERAAIARALPALRRVLQVLERER